MLRRISEERFTHVGSCELRAPIYGPTVCICVRISDEGFTHSARLSFDVEALA